MRLERSGRRAQTPADMRPFGRLCTLVGLVLLAACAPKQTLSAAPPPATPTRAVWTGAEVSVTVRTSPDVAQFRQVLERELGRAGFRVLPSPEADTLLLNLLGDGSSTSGASGAGSNVQQKLIIDMNVSLDGRLQGEHRAEVEYVAVLDRNDKNDDFNKFTARVADYQRQAQEWLAVELTNQLITSLQAKKPGE